METDQSKHQESFGEYQPIQLVENAHHWIIEEAQGPTSTGMCRNCGKTKEFKNWLVDSDFVTNEEHRVSRESGI